MCYPDNGESNETANGTEMETRGYVMYNGLKTQASPEGICPHIAPNMVLVVSMLHVMFHLILHDG